MKKKIVKKEIKKEVKVEYTPKIIIEIEKLISNSNVIPTDNLIFEVPPVNRQRTKEAEKL